MSKKYIVRKSTRPVNLYKNGISSYTNQNMLSGSLGHSLVGTGIGAGGALVGNMAGSLIGGGKSTGVGNAIGSVGGTLGTAVGAINPVLGGIVSAGTGILGGVTNALFGSSLNKERIQNIENANNSMNSIVTTAGGTEEMANQWATQNLGSNFTKSDIGKDGVFSNKASNKYKKLVAEQSRARQNALLALNNGVNNVDTQAGLNAAANYSALGGIINIKSNAPLSPFGNRYEEGGNLYTSINNKGQHGGEFSNGMTVYGNGGTHEENPNQGIQIGNDSAGTPNLVEEGEVRYKDLIFSNRLYADGGLLTASKLPTSYNNHSMAKIAEGLATESSERPNDPISRRGLESSLGRLKTLQETVQARKLVEEYKAKAKAMGVSLEDYILMIKKNQEEQAQQQPQQQGVPPSAIVPEEAPKESNQFATGGKVNFEDNWNRGNTPLGYNSYKNEFGINPYSRTAPLLSSPLVNAPNFVNNSTPVDNTTKSSSFFNSADLRYAPVVGAGIGVLTDALGYTNKADYSDSDIIKNAANNIPDVVGKPLGNYMTYNPLDRDYYLNKINSQAGASRRAIENQSGGNRAAATAGILAADYNAQSLLGDFSRKAEEYNATEKARVASFNRETDKYNSDQALSVSSANARKKEIQLQAAINEATMRNKIGLISDAAKNSNLSNFISSIGNIGIENFNRNMVNSDRDKYYTIDSKGRTAYKKAFFKLNKDEQSKIKSHLKNELKLNKG